MHALALATVLSVALIPCGDKLSKADANKLRRAYTEALADASGKATKQLVSLGEKLAKKQSPEGVIAALAEGPDYDKGDPKPRGKGRSKEELEEYGTAWTGFRFEYDGDDYGYAVDIPRGYDPDEPTPLLLDPGHGSGAHQDQEGKAGFLGYFRGRANASELKDCLIVRTEIIEQLGAGGLRGGWPEAEVLPVWDAFFRDLSSRFHIDPDRIYVSGLSQTGYWTWYLGRTQADRFAGIAPMGAVTWQVSAALENFGSLPVYVLHGDADQTCPVGQPRETTARLKELGAPVKYREIEGGDHTYGGTWQYLGDGLDWLVEHGPRRRYPESVTKRLGSDEESWCYWIRVTKLKKTNGGRPKDRPTALIEGSREGQRIELRSEGVRSVELCLADGMLDLYAPVTVVWNDKVVHEGLVELDLERALEVAVERADWSAGYLGFLELKAP